MRDLRTPEPMPIDISATDRAAYRQMLRCGFEDVRRGLYRLQHLLDTANPAPDFAARLTVQVGHLRAFVDALAEAKPLRDPVLADDLHRTYGAGLTAIDTALADGKAADACALAGKLVALLVVELSWMLQP